MGYYQDTLKDALWELEKVTELKDKFKARAKELKKQNELLKNQLCKSK